MARTKLSDVLQSELKKTYNYLMQKLSEHKFDICQMVIVDML